MSVAADQGFIPAGRIKWLLQPCKGVWGCSKDVVLSRALLSVAEMHFFVKGAPGTASPRQKACCIQPRGPVAPCPGPCPSSAEGGFEVGTCCGSPERACRPPKSISSGAGLSRLRSVCSEPCKASPAAAPSDPSPNQHRPPSLQVRAGWQPQLWACRPQLRDPGGTWKRGFPSPGCSAPLPWQPQPGDSACGAVAIR